VEILKMLQRTKFGGDQSYLYRDTAVFRYWRWRPSTILDFKNPKILLANRVQRVEMHHRTKISSKLANPMKRYRDFSIFMMAAACCLGFVMCDIANIDWELVSWSLTSLFSTNMAISETKINWDKWHTYSFVRAGCPSCHPTVSNSITLSGSNHIRTR